MKRARSTTDLHRSSLGFTLLEVLSALMISSAALTASLSLTVYLFQSGAWSDHLQEAKFAGESLFEELSGEPYDDLIPGNDTFHGYGRNWTVTSNDHYQIVDVTVSWDGTEGGNKRISMQWLVTDPEVEGGGLP
jgi:prepilin-type N-terminal cleavage/methylation domain-containing protein